MEPLNEPIPNPIDYYRSIGLVINEDWSMPGEIRNNTIFWIYNLYRKRLDLDKIDAEFNNFLNMASNRYNSQIPFNLEEFQNIFSIIREDINQGIKNPPRKVIEAFYSILEKQIDTSIVLYRINKYLTLKLKYGRISIFVKSEEFLSNRTHFLIDNADPVDKLHDVCLMFKKWHENHYNHRYNVLDQYKTHSLLEKLMIAGDPIARKAYKENFAQIPTFKINKYLTLKLEYDITVIYVNSIKFNQCKYLLMNISSENIQDYDEISSIDEAADVLDRSLESSSIERISPEVEFWGHCSNLQAWYENDYNTCILHRNLAFPLLKRLTEVKKSLKKKYTSITKSIETPLKIQGNFSLDFLKMSL